MYLPTPRLSFHNKHLKKRSRSKPQRLMLGNNETVLFPKQYFTCTVTRLLFRTHDEVFP